MHVQLKLYKTEIQWLGREERETGQKDRDKNPTDENTIL